MSGACPRPPAHTSNAADIPLPDPNHSARPAIAPFPCEAQRLALSLMMNRNPGLAVRLGEKLSTELMLFRSHISAAKPVYFRQGITEDALVKTGAGYLPVCFKNAARGSIRQQPKTLRLPECTQLRPKLLRRFMFHHQPARMIGAL